MLIQTWTWTTQLTILTHKLPKIEIAHVTTMFIEMEKGNIASYHPGRALLAVGYCASRGGVDESRGGISQWAAVSPVRFTVGCGVVGASRCGLWCRRCVSSWAAAWCISVEGAETEACAWWSVKSCMRGGAECLCWVLK